MGQDWVPLPPQVQMWPSYRTPRWYFMPSAHLPGLQLQHASTTAFPQVCAFEGVLRDARPGDRFAAQLSNYQFVSHKSPHILAGEKMCPVIWYS